MDINRIRQGLATAARAVGVDAQGHRLTCLPYVPDAVTVPTFYAGAVDISYDRAFGRGQDEATVHCTLLVSRASDLDGQAALDAYMAGAGSMSIKAAIEATRGLPGEAAMGGACDDLHVTGVQGHQVYTVGQTQYYGATWLVRVIGPGE